MSKIYINCVRCGKDLECEELDDVYTSKIDDTFLCKDCYKKEKPDYIQQLKQQLVEKDEQIKRRIAAYEKQFIEQTNENYELRQQLAEQNKITFCIEKLEKVKELLLIESKQNPIVYDVTNDTIGGAIDRDKCFKLIDNQIEELKKEK